MDQVNCRLDIPDVEGLKPGEITVGRHVFLSCEGDWDKSFDFTQARVKSEDSQKYAVQVLKAEARSGQAFDVDLTTYVAGSLTLPEMILTDGTREISLGRQQFETTSVLQQPQHGQEPQKPYGYIFPMPLHWPLMYTLFIVVAVILFLTALIYQLRKAARYSRLIADLKQHSSSVAPDLQFYKSLRVAEKQGYPLPDLEQVFRLYVLRVFGVPMFVLNQRQIVGFLKKRKPQYKNERHQIEVFLSEFEEIVRTQKELSESEKSDLVQKLYRFVEHTQKIEAVL